MRLNLIKRRIARIMAFVLIFLMTAEPFSGAYIYADEEYGSAVQAEEQTMPEAAEEDLQTLAEEAAGDAPKHTVHIWNREENAYETFDVDDGSTIVSVGRVPQSPNIGDEITDAVGDWRFKNWYIGSNPSVEFKFSTPVTSTLDIKQHWVQLHTIDFNSMGGSSVSSQRIEENITVVTKPDPDPTRDKYRFLDWYKDTSYNTLYNFGGTESSSFSLYAKWMRVYDVQFIGHGGKFDYADQWLQHIDDGSTAVSPNMTRTGHDFLGWYTEKDGGTKWDFSTPITGDRTLHAHWDPQPRTVTLEYRRPDQSVSNTVIKNVAFSQKLTGVPEPSRYDGYTFAGWYTDPGNVYTDLDNYQVNENIKLYTKYEKIKYTVKFKCNSETVQGATKTPSDITGLEYGEKVTRPAEDPEHTNFYFTGWYRDEACTDPWNFNKTVSDGDAVAGVITIYAGWKMKTFTVSFDSNGGPSVSAQTVDYGKKLTEPKIDKDGFKLLGWCKDVELKNYFDFSSGIYADAWLYAKWKEAHVVSFNTAGGTPISPIKVVSGQKLYKKDIPATTKTGYKLKDWYTISECEAGYEYDFDSDVDVDITLYAAWEKEKYTVTFESNGSSLATQQVYYQDKVIRPSSDPERTGFDFLGWYKNKQCTVSYDFSTELMPDHDVTIYAGWGPVMLTVSFDKVSSDAVINFTKKTVSYGSLLPEPTVTREGYTLDGWYPNKNYIKTEKWDFSSKKVTENGWLYANWLVRKCKVTFETNGGSVIPSQIVVYGETVSVSTIPSKAGFRFGGWYKNSSLTTPYDFSSQVKDDITIYAKWVTAPSYKITAVASPTTYGSIAPSGTFSVKESASQKFTFSPKTGYEAYLLKIDNVDTPFEGNSYILESISKNHTVTVYFREIPVVKHIISASCADSFGMISPGGEVPVIDGQNATFYFDALDGYELDYLDIDGSSITVSTNSYTFIKVETGHTIIAHFKKADPPAPVGHAKVKFIVDGEEIAKEIVSLGQVVKRPPDPEKSGHIFMGWYEGNWKWNFSDPVEKDLILTARFISQTVSKDDVHSGMDKEMDLSDPDNITMVKGQSYDFGPGIWNTSNKQIVTINKKTGKAKAKNPSNVPVTITNTAVTPNVQYKIKVVDPELSAKKLTMGVGSTQKITVSYSGGLNIAWASSNPRVAAVDEGVITALAKGKANITAYMNGKGYTCKVTVSDKFTAPATFDGVYAFTLRPAQTLDLHSIAVNGEKPNKLDWRLSDESGTRDLDKSGWLAWDDGIVRVSVTGQLKAKACGVSTLIGRRGDTRVKTMKVTVDTIPSKTETYINVGKNEKLSYYKVNNKKAHWSATNEGDIVLLGSDPKTMGTVYGVNVGTSVVSCSYNGMHYSTKVHVEDPDLSTEDQRIGRTATNEYLLTLKTGTRFVIDISQHVIWKSKDNKIAFADENGIIEGRKQGKTTVSAKINGTTVKIKVFVTQ